jgi:hypothetical protein
MTFIAAPLAPGEIAALIAGTLAFVAALFALARLPHFGGRRHRRRPASAAPPGMVPAEGMRDSARQMQAVAAAEFARRRLLNREEYPLLLLLERLAAEQRAGLRVMAQTSLGEVIEPVRRNLAPEEIERARASINAKRLDFAVFDRYGFLLLGIEYQGTGHHHAESFMRDAVKREALRKAGVPLLEVPAGFRPEDVAAEVRRLLAPQAAAPSGATPLPAAAAAARS